jgi:PAS domain S-box-containing protein
MSMHPFHSSANAEAQSPRARELFGQLWQTNAERTDRMFAVLMFLQWIAAVVVAATLSPLTWQGANSEVHPHVWLAILLGGTLASLPVYLAWKFPGRTVTRHVIAIAQIMFSSLLIHVSGGRIETHFHVFGSLAFLAFYRDWHILVPATLLVAIDHFVRGVFWPETVFGVATASPWRWVEHSAWVIYEDVFLIMSCRNGVRDMWAAANRTATLEQMNRDVRQQSDELEAAFQSKHAIVETALDAIVNMDQNGRIVAWNSKAEAAFGWSEQEALGRSLAETIVPPRFREQHTRGLQTYLTSGVENVLNRRVEVYALHRDGREFPVELSIAPIGGGDSVSFCAFVRDITERVQAAEALRSAKDAAETANQAKTAFLANMSHEIRTPLNGILGFTEVLIDHLDGDREERRDHLQTIRDSGRHLLALINDVLDLSKIESGQMDVEIVRCSPHDIIAEVISILRVRAQERGITLEYFWKSEVPDSMETDPARLRQILMNLAGNAIKFTEVGSVQVAVRLIADASPRLVVDVIDTGVGISSESIERIFDPFVQADNSITRRFGGTGLGLSISRRLARLLGGDLTVESQPGRGSIFTATIAVGSLDGVRLNHSTASDIVRAQPAAVRTGRRTLPPCRILLVEDGATNRKLVTLVLEQAGATVATAENGRAGIEAVGQEDFDLILMDMQMPVLDGYSATRELRQQGCRTPILALTAHAMSSDEQKCREAGCSGYLTKPIDPRSLLEAVATALATADTETPSGANHLADPPLVSTLPTEDLDFREIVEDFTASLRNKLATARAACVAGDLRTVAEFAHWLKGSGGTAGFDAFTRPAGELEMLARRAQSQKIPQRIADLERIAQRIRIDATDDARMAHS